jgi:hypothetical protein
MASVFGAAGIAYNTADVFEFGSTRWILRKIADTDGTPAEGDTADDWAQGPWRMKFSITPSVSKKEKEGEDGSKITTRTDVNYSLEITAGQKNRAALVELMKKANDASAKGSYTQFVLEGMADADGSESKRIYLTCFGTPADPPAIASDADPVYRFDLVKATDDIELDFATDLTMHTGQTTGFGSSTGTLTQESGEYFGMVSLA